MNPMLANDPIAQQDNKILERLTKELTNRSIAYQRYDNYYAGNHRLAFASEKFRQAFGGLFGEFSDNWVPIVVDAVEERLDVSGFRIDPEDEGGDEDAWRIWQTNNLDADSQVGHTEALINGIAYTMVGSDGAGGAKITIEHPSQTIVGWTGSDHRRPVAALKKWTDEWTGHEFSTLWLPQRIWRLERKTPTGEWETRSGDDGPEDNELGIVPFVPLINRPRLLGHGVSEIDNMIALQDAVNKVLADLMIAAEFSSFRQRWMTGAEIPVDPETGQPVEDWKAAITKLWNVEDKDAKFGEFSETNLRNFVATIEMLVQHIASQTRTPPHYFYLSGQFPSGESIKSAETGLVAKARRKMRHFGESWEQTMRLAGRVSNNERLANATMAETIWGDPESRTESEHVDAILKKQALGVPAMQLWEDLGYTSTQIARFRSMRAEDQLLGIDLAELVAAEQPAAAA